MISAAMISTGKRLKKPAGIMTRPQNTQIHPASRWVLFQFSSLFNVHGILMPFGQIIADDHRQQTDEQGRKYIHSDLFPK